MKKILLFITILTIAFSNAFGITAKYTDENIHIDAIYNDIIIPGDAIFVRLTMTMQKNHKKNKLEAEKKAQLELYQNEKLIESSPFYSVSPKKKNPNYSEMLTGLPLSSWLSDSNFTLKIVFTLDNSEYKEFELPVSFKGKKFDEEILDLDEKNTAIKTNNSPQRVAQIEKLNNILFTSMPADVYSFSPFVAPTSSTRYTAHFGDRRTYKYTNGKSSTNLHYGNDYGVPEGSIVTACAEGRVVMAENRISTGWSIVIEHLPGLYSLYYHLSEMNVKEGEYVKQGEIIGKSGSTGLATGPHLHWEVRLNGSAVRPEFFMDNFTFK